VGGTLLIPHKPEDLTPDWLTAVLLETGALRAGAVTAAHWDRVGAEFGFTGLVGRVLLTYADADADAPASVIVKLPLAEGYGVSRHRAMQQRDPVLAGRYYERCAREVRFYREVGVGKGAPVPRLYYAAEDAKSRRVVLVLEDLSTGRPGDALHGCSVDEAALLLEAIAPFHARWWGQRAPVAVFPRWGTDGDVRQVRYDAQVGVFLERYGDKVPGDALTIVERLRSQLGSVIERLAMRPHTLIHADLHLDNVIFDSSGLSPSVAVVDWQTTVIGPAAVDVALFLFGALSVDDRRRAEDALLEHYVELLGANGVVGYSRDDLRLDCGMALLSLFAGTVGWLASVDRNDLAGRERALQDAALGNGRLLAALLELPSSAARLVR
jgi:hypothetical protein